MTTRPNDELDDVVAHRTARNPEFPRLLEAAAARRELMDPLRQARIEAGLSQTEVAAGPPRPGVAILACATGVKSAPVMTTSILVAPRSTPAYAGAVGWRRFGRTGVVGERGRRGWQRS